jgi:hypothetical protein
MKGHSWHLRGCHPIRSFTLLLNGTIPLLFVGGLWMDMKCLGAFHNQNTLGNFFKCFVLCSLHSLIHGARISILQLFIIKSIPTGAPYVTLHIKIWWRKVNMCGFGSGNWFFSCKFARSAEASKKRSKSCTPAREDCNKYDLTSSPCCWLANHNECRWFAISSSHLFAVPVWVYGWDCKKVNN